MPSLVAFAAATLLALATSLLPKSHAIVLQATIYAGALAASVGYLSQQPTTIQMILTVAKSCSDEVRFALTALVISVAYFGGSFYLSGKNSKRKISMEMPASCDTITDFEVPASLPKEDQALFLQMFET